MLHLFLLSPKSLLHNTFRGPRYRFALFVGTSIARPKGKAHQFHKVRALPLTFIYCV